MVNKEAIAGCLLGTAIGDSLGLPYEGLSKKRGLKLFPDCEKHNLLFNKGMISDDTEHICITAQSLVFSAGDKTKFANSMGWGLRFWLLGLPAGIGFATLRACIKLWLGFNPASSGVFSAGNGPAMRSPIIGVCYGHDPEMLKQLVKISTRISHTDPKAEYGALAAALAAYMASQNTNSNIDPHIYYHQLTNLLDDNAKEFLELIDKVIISVQSDEDTQTFADNCGFKYGISGYIYHTVPVVIHCWLRNQHDFKTALTDIIKCGGDTDTTGAILGAIIGSGVGRSGIPENWLLNLFEWPRNIKWIDRLTDQLVEVLNNKKSIKPITAPFYAIFLRNTFFLVVVILHIIRRMLPPY